MKYLILIIAMLALTSCSDNCTHPEGHLWGTWTDDLNEAGQPVTWQKTKRQSRYCQHCGMHEGDYN